MHLLEIDSQGEIRLTEDLHDGIPPYAILSHLWGDDKDEVKFDDLKHESWKRKAGYTKILFCARQVKKDNLKYFWVDTCCINQANFTAYSEAINSMFRWYRDAAKCYVYLPDVSVREGDENHIKRIWKLAFRRSRWFTRGWTLQELLAPASVEFFSQEEERLGNKETLEQQIHEVTGIPIAALRGASLSKYSVEERLRWAANRNTTKKEDKAYCLLGIFDVFMPLIYGEGGKNALNRLRMEIDQSRSKPFTHTPAATSSPVQCDSLPSSTEGNVVHGPRRGSTTAHEQGKYQRLLRSLTFERMDSRLLNITNALPQTCRWIFDEEKFKTWITRNEVEDNHGFLWIKGKPGSGKSTIMKEALKMVKREQPRDIIISYFFNARAPGILEKSSVGMYRTLVHQILQARPQSRGLFSQMFAMKDREGSVDDWTPTELQGFLTDVVESLGDRTLDVFIDALDEGDENDVRQLVAFLEELSHRAVACSTSLRICLSSRHYPHISIRKGLHLVMERQDGQRDDIDRYVRLRLNGDESHGTNRLREQVCQKSSRVFLWVVLVIPMLNELYDRGLVAAMEARLKELPDTLDALFAEILARNAEGIDSSVLLLQWVLFSMRPLSPVELYHGIQSGLASSPIEGATSMTKETMDRYLLNCSRGLIEVTRTEPPVVQFVHEAVRDFLIGANGLKKVDTRLAGNVKGISHEQLHTACLRYFDQCLPLNPDYRGEFIPKWAQPLDLQQKFPFSKYASTCMFPHADVAESRGIPHRAFLRRFQSKDSHELLKWIRFRNSFQRLEVYEYTLDVHLLYILAEKNLANLANVLIDDGVDVNARGGSYGNALQAACAKYREQMAKLLVESGANINAQGGPYGNALQAAAARGHERLAQLLIEKGADVNAQGGPYGNALQAAAVCGHELLAQLLIESGAEVNAQGGDYGSALQAAAARGHKQLAQLLIEKGAVLRPTGNGRQAA
ncbi:Pfs, NB-ARC and Ankyrin domain protein [Cladophialophora carrionii]|uniref:Pfs, NB-ARC and Ankyrin domain protein n=1 Tax=Cladophialophora carrionii TaxID=86049 RepID=A0A1C1D2R4_9EURO|nr:Pfs, NB-ARC and Ankyrin domain protein [Cladophialophora carrionii]